MGAHVIQGSAGNGLQHELGLLKATFEERLRQALGEADPADLLQMAMREAALGAGKRMRPLLMMLLARDLGCAPAGMLDAACAVEMVHAASLILDDMPCMDDAMLRRGRPTIHLRFGQDVAILAAISLLSRAFGLVASAPGVPADARARMSSTLSNAIGTKGLAMGQYQDLRSVRGQRSCDDIATTNELKTGMLFDVAVNMATVIAESGDSVVLPLKRFARAAGQAFQIRDDLLDCLDSAVTGKDAGNDAGKATIVLTLGAEEAQRQLAGLVQEADRHLVSALGEQAGTRAFIRALFGDQSAPAAPVSRAAPVAVRGAAYAS
ncbi:MAG: polyprenyl synthetase family protein [Pseudomonadota bacterium]|nr:polyprenyl synthetase family protein [Pseudomonadota bacterium]